MYRRINNQDFMGGAPPSAPFDGVRPEDFPETYATFTNRRCMLQCMGVPVFFVRETEPRAAYCLTCYAPARRIDNHLIAVYGNYHESVTIHKPDYKCAECNRQLTRKRPIIECGECTLDSLPVF